MTDWTDKWPIGAKVRWRPEITKSDWVGVVTGYRHLNMLEIDGRSGVGAGLLERVDDMGANDQQTNILYNRIAELEAERDALADVVAMQMEAISAPAAASPLGDSEWLAKLRRLVTYWGEDWYRTPLWRPMLKQDGPIAQIVAHIDRGP